MKKQPDAIAEAKHTHYVSNQNSSIHPAMTAPAGYEDEHPSEWRPATAAEIRAYHEGADLVSDEVVDSALPIAPESMTPRTLKLEGDDVAEAPVMSAIPPPAAKAITKKA